MTQLATYRDGKVTVSALVWDDILDALADNGTAWEGEEHSVRSEHRELIERLENLDSYLAAHGCSKSDTLPEAPPTLDELRSDGHAVCVFNPAELAGVNPSRVEDRMCEIGWEVIEALTDDPDTVEALMEAANA